jgi:CubicO group peptidase (beta-lactamase class C family)
VAGTRLALGTLLAEDRGWTYEDAIEFTRATTAKFPPPPPGGRFYSDTNYQLLGRIIEMVTGTAYGDCVDQRMPPAWA